MSEMSRGANGQSGPNSARWSKGKDRLGQVRATAQHWQSNA